jgi:hypothetical protein
LSDPVAQGDALGAGARPGAPLLVRALGRAARRALPLLGLALLPHVALAAAAGVAARSGGSRAPALALLLLGIALGAVATPAMQIAASEEHRPLPAALRGGLQRALPFLGATVLMAAVGVLSLVPFVVAELLAHSLPRAVLVAAAAAALVFAVWILCRFLLVAPVVALEPGSSLRALRRSARLLRDRRGAAALLFVAGYLAIRAVGFAATRAGGVEPPGLLVGAALGTLFAAYATAVLVVLYEDARRREAAAPESGSGAAAPPLTVF